MEPAVTLRLISDPALLGLEHVNPAWTDGDGVEHPATQHWFSLDHGGIGVRRRGGNWFEWRAGDGWGRVRGLPMALTMVALHTPDLAHLCAPMTSDEAACQSP